MNESPDPAVRQVERVSEGQHSETGPLPVTSRPSQPSSPRSHGVSQHGEGCRCTRCVGFTPGPNGTAITRMTHGATSLVQIQGRAGEVAEAITETLVREQLWRDSFSPTVEACSIVLVRLERAQAALEQVDERMEAEGGPLAAYLGLTGEGDPLSKLRADAAKWANVARGYLNDLGMTPRSLAAIAKDTGIARSTRANAALAALTEHVEREHVA